MAKKAEGEYDELVQSSPMPNVDEIVDVHSEDEAVLRDVELDEEKQLPKPNFPDRIPFQQHRDGDDVFWVLVFLCSLLALAIVTSITVYLARTDFFESHQTDLLGSTIDDHFTVISGQETSAKISLKSGYSSRPFAQAAISLYHGVLQIGRMSSNVFSGLELLTNGTVRYTNEIVTPKITADQLIAGNALVFNDGTTMTTAADISGGLKQKGDLNFASDNGAITASAGGQQRFRVDSDGTVMILDPTDVSPVKNGFVFDAPKHQMTLANDFKLYYNEKGAGFSTKKSLHLNSNAILLGGNTPSVTIQVPDQSKVSSHQTKGVLLQMIGQQVFDKGAGGDVLIEGGKGDLAGGNVIISGGSSHQNAKIKGPVLINAGEDDEAETIIGSKTKFSHTKLFGNVEINSGVTDSSIAFTVNHQMQVDGNRMSIASKIVHIGSEKTSDQVDFEAKSVVEIGTKTPAIVIGSNTTTNTVHIASKDIQITSDRIQLGQSMKTEAETTLSAGTVRMIAGDKIIMGDNSNVSLTILKGRVQIGENNEFQVWDKAVNLGGQTVKIGSSTSTSLELDGNEIVVGTSSKTLHLGHDQGESIVLGSSVSMKSATGPLTLASEKAGTIIDAASTVSIGSSTAKAIDIGGSDEVSIRVSSQNTVVVDGKTLRMGANATELEIGSSTSEDMTVSIASSMDKLEIGTVKGDITIGSSSGSIHLLGDVKVNGDSIQNRRLNDVNNQYRDFIVLDTAAMIYHSSFSDWKIIQGSEIRRHVQSGRRFARLSLVVNAVRVLGGSGKVKCSVMSNGTTSLLDIVSRVDVVEDKTQEGLFDTMSISSLVAIESSVETIGMRCMKDVVYDSYSISIDFINRNL